MTSLFGLPVAPNTFGGNVLALLLAMVFGGLIGLEREWHGHPAGLRTHILVCVGATLFTLISIAFARNVPGVAPDNSGRIAANVVVGIGFLGAGSIIRDGASVHGLTSAASIWVVAAIGMAIASGPETAKIGLAAAVIVFVTLTLLASAEAKLRDRRFVRVLDVEMAASDRASNALLVLLVDLHITLYGIETHTEPDPSGGQTQIRRLHLRIGLPPGFDRNALTNSLSNVPDIRSFQLD